MYSFFQYIYLTPYYVFLPGESQGRGSLVGRHLWGHRVGHDWSNLAAAAIKLFSFCTTKETIEKEKATYPTGENICKVYDQSGLNSRIYKELYNPTTKAKMIQRIGRRPKQTFLKRKHAYGQEAHNIMFNVANY